MHCDIESTTDVDCMNSCRCCIGVLYHWLFSQKHVSVFLRPIQHTLPCSISFLTCSYLLLACYFYLCVVLTSVLVENNTLQCRINHMAKAAYAAGPALSRGPALSDCAIFCSALPF